MAFGAEISNRKSLGFQVESLSKLATIFVSSCVLSCAYCPSNTENIRALFCRPRIHNPNDLAEDAAA